MKKQTIEQIKRTHCSWHGPYAEKYPEKCILMVENAKGVRFPQVDPAQCVKSELCLHLCQITDTVEPLYNKSERRRCCGTIKNERMLLKSSSGGVFGSLAEYIVNVGGYIYGCHCSDELEALHILDNKEPEFKKMYGSKHVPARIEHCFPEIEKRLDFGDTVMFSGTGGQIAAGKSNLL